MREEGALGGDDHTSPVEECPKQSTKALRGSVEEKTDKQPRWLRPKLSDPVRGREGSVGESEPEETQESFAPGSLGRDREYPRSLR